MLAVFSTKIEEDLIKELKEVSEKFGIKQARIVTRALETEIKRMRERLDPY